MCIHMQVTYPQSMNYTKRITLLDFLIIKIQISDKLNKRNHLTANIAGALDKAFILNLYEAVQN